MSALIGALRVSLSMDTAAFEKGADIAQKRAAAMGKNLQSMGDRLTGLGTKLSVGLTLPFTALVSKAIPAAIQSRQAIGQVNAALASMGPVAGRSSEQLKKMAGELQHISTFDDDEILQKVTANMLTFGRVSGEAFDRAQLAAINLSARLGQDLQSSAVQVGKALNDPIKGLTSLQRVGVQFSATQKEQIKNFVEQGNIAAAQGIILGELERQFGGAAKAMRDASPGADLQEKWRTFQEVVGEVALKVLPPLTNFLTKLLATFNALSPGMQTVVVGAAALAAALGPILLVTGQLLSIGGALVPMFAGLAGGTAAAGAAAGGAGAALATLTPILGAVALAVGAVVLAYKNWDTIGPYIQGVVQRTQEGAAQVNANLKSIQDGANALDQRLGIPTKQQFIQSLISAVRNAVQTINGNLKAIQDAAAAFDRAVAAAFGNAVGYVQRMVTGVSSWLQRLSGPFNWVRQKAKEVGDAFYNLYDRVVGHSYVPDMVDEIGQHMARLSGKMVDPANQATKSTGDAFAALKDRVGSILDRLFPERAAFNQFKQDLQDLETYAKRTGMSVEALAEAVGKLSDEYYGMPKVDLGETSLVPSNLSTLQSGTVDSVLGKMPQLIDKTHEWNEALKDVGAHAMQSIEDNLLDVIEGTKSVAEAFRDMVRDIVRDLLRLAIRKFITMPLFNSLFGGMSEGGAVGFATGGFVSGPGTSLSDSIPAMLSNGEFVINAKATKRFLPLLEQINSGAMKLASGGLVPARMSRPRIPALAGIPSGSVGATNNFNVTVHGSMSDQQARRTGMQIAAGARAEMGRAAAKGF